MSNVVTSLAPVLLTSSAIEQLQCLQALVETCELCAALTISAC